MKEEVKITEQAREGGEEEKTKICLAQSEEKKIVAHVIEEVNKYHETKSVDLSSTQVALAESEEKIEPLVIEEVKKTDEQENPKPADHSPIVAPPLTEAEEKIEARQYDFPVMKTDEEEKTKAEDSPIAPLPLVESEDDVFEDKTKTDEEESLKVDNSSIGAFLLAESEQKIEDKHIEPLLEELNKSNEEEKPEADSSSNPAVPSAELESEENVDCKTTKPLVIKEEEKSKIEELSIASIQLAEIQEKNEDKKIEPPAVQELNKIDEEGNQKVEDSPTPAIEDKTAEVPIIDVVEKIGGEEEKPNAEESPIAAIQPAESEKKIDDNQIESSIYEVVKETDEGKKPKTEEDPPSPIVLLAESEEKIEHNQTEPGVIAEVKKTYDSSVANISFEDNSVVAPDISSMLADIVKSQTEKAEIAEKQLHEEIRIVDVPKSSVDKKEQVEDLPVKGESEVTEPVMKESAVVEPVESLEVELVKNEEEVKAEPRGDEKEFGARNDSLEVELVKNEEEVKAEARGDKKEFGATNEAKNVKNEEEKGETVKQGEMEVKGCETMKSVETKSEKQNVVDIGDHGVANMEFTEDSDDMKTSQEDLPKEEVSAKSARKQSTTILGKVKQTLVKAKKAIIGKSPNSKTPPSEAKGDVKV